MFKGSYQRKLLTIMYSGGSRPLELWDVHVKNGWTRRVKDEEMGSIVFEIAGTNVATAFIVSPPDSHATLSITLPFITMFIKNLKRYFTFEIQILDDKRMRRRFRFSNYQSSTKVRPFMCSVPLALKPGWNQMQLNLANFTTRAYGTNYLETQRVQIHANCRIRRVYFSDRLYAEEELPRDYRIYLNVRQAPGLAPAASQQTAPDLQKGGSVIRAAPSSILKQASKTDDVVTSSEIETSGKSATSTTEQKSLRLSGTNSSLRSRKSSIHSTRITQPLEEHLKSEDTKSLQKTKSVVFEGEGFEEQELLSAEGERTTQEKEHEGEEEIQVPDAPQVSEAEQSPRSEVTESEPAESEPTGSEFAESEPAESEPAESEPAESEPMSESEAEDVDVHSPPNKESTLIEKSNVEEEPVRD